MPLEAPRAGGPTVAAAESGQEVMGPKIDGNESQPLASLTLETRATEKGVSTSGSIVRRDLEKDASWKASYKAASLPADDASDAVVMIIAQPISSQGGGCSLIRGNGLFMRE